MLKFEVAVCDLKFREKHMPVKVYNYDPRGQLPGLPFERPHFLEPLKAHFTEDALAFFVFSFAIMSLRKHKKI